MFILLSREFGPKRIQQHSFVIEWPANRRVEANVRFDEFELFCLSLREARTEGHVMDFMTAVRSGPPMNPPNLFA